MELRIHGDKSWNQQSRSEWVGNRTRSWRDGNQNPSLEHYQISIDWQRGMDTQNPCGIGMEFRIPLELELELE